MELDLGAVRAFLVLADHQHFHRGVEIDIVTSSGLRSGRPALVDGSIDVAFARVVGVSKVAVRKSVESAPMYSGSLTARRGQPWAVAGQKQRRRQMRRQRSNDGPADPMAARQVSANPAGPYLRTTSSARLARPSRIL
ncbi:hypothetical protein ACFYV7_36130 [Nocardia suismassiliense]|uniref:LysR family transcriptional regulator n=1 Tax=Nocardia suismassiliense TaxID=2077092 RepID=A0ABW6R419_9NOCA